MTNNADAKLAREWAEWVKKMPDAHSFAELTAAQYILATTTPPTMADIEWDAAEHVGLCAESQDDGVVRMIGLDWVNDHADHIMCYLGNGQFDSLPFRALTPVPGTRLDLTPRREPESSEAPSTNNVAANLPRPEDVPVGEAWEVLCDGVRYIGLRNEIDDATPWWLIKIGAHGEYWVDDADVTILRRLVPESTPDHPAVLTTEEDYENAPVGTVVAAESEEAWIKVKAGPWEVWRGTRGFNDSEMVLDSRQVVRWGWGA